MRRHFHLASHPLALICLSLNNSPESFANTVVRCAYLRRSLSYYIVFDAFTNTNKRITMSAQQEQVVNDLISTFADGWPDNLDRTMPYLAEDACYEMAVPLTEVIVGRNNIRAKIQAMVDMYGSNRSHILKIGSGHNVVFTERLDQALTDKGWIKIPLVAVFELNDANKITAWREYLDMGSVIEQQGREAVIGMS